MTAILGRLLLDGGDTSVSPWCSALDNDIWLDREYSDVRQGIYWVVTLEMIKFKREILLSLLTNHQG